MVKRGRPRRNMQQSDAFRKNIKELSDEQFLSQSDIAIFCRVTPQAVQRWFGEGVIPRPKHLKKLCELFKCTKERLLK